MKRTKQFFFALTGQYNAPNTCSKANFKIMKLLPCSDTGGQYFDKETYIFTLTGQCSLLATACSAVQCFVALYCISLNINRLQSDACDLTEETAFFNWVGFGQGSQVLKLFGSVSVRS